MLDFTSKLDTYTERTLFSSLDPAGQTFVRDIAVEHRLTFQEFRRVVLAARDLTLWREGDLGTWWRAEQALTRLSGRPLKKHLLARLQVHMESLGRAAKAYSHDHPLTPTHRQRKPVVSVRSDKKVWGMCPVASEKTVCCNLRTIDAVENCTFGCSYCSVQTFYSDRIVFDPDLERKLGEANIEADRFYHFGTGQASDSLAWGNRGGMLDVLCGFARKHRNVLLEFKTKSDNIDYFLEHEIPANVVCSWSVNTPTVIKNEEHFTAGFERRMAAARRAAEAGVRVAFHFHPMVYYKGWDRDYPDVARTLIDSFDAREVAFLSMGSVTLIKPVIDKIREIGNPTRIHQMEMVPDPHGKLTYPDDTKVMMFKAMYEALSTWHDRVFMYLCMEKASIWKRSFGYVYPTNDEFERDFGLRTLGFQSVRH